MEKSKLRDEELSQQERDMPIRIMGFDIDPELVTEALPQAFPIYGLSMTLPYLEPYLIRTMRESLKHCTDESVAREVKQFIGQEAQHYKQHAVLNNLIREISPEMEGLKALEQRLESDYQTFTNTKSLKFNLAYAEGFEAATFAGARQIFELEAWSRFSALEGSDLLKLFKWHVLEEVEHRKVTFNIYDHLYGDYWYRARVGAYGQYHFFKYVFLFSKFIAKNAPQALERGKSLSTPKEINGEIKDLFSLLTKIINVYSPYYNPKNYDLHPLVSTYSKQFSKEAKDIRSVS